MGQPDVHFITYMGLYMGPSWVKGGPYWSRGSPYWNTQPCAWGERQADGLTCRSVQQRLEVRNHIACLLALPVQLAENCILNRTTVIHAELPRQGSYK